MGRVIIGMDPHKRSATIEVINDCEQALAQVRARVLRVSGRG